jgi:trehalose 6-phosphate phosphatase
MRSFFASWDTIARRLKEAPHWLLLFDYDGTLAPIRDRPEYARLPASTRQRLRRLADANGNFVGIVSGREIHDLRRLVALDQLIYVGNHGFEIQGTGWGFLYPTSQERLRQLRATIAHVQREIRPFREAWVENKKWTISVHYRQVRGRQRPQIERLLRRSIIPKLENDGFSITRGKKVVEIRPYHHWNKGSAVQWVRKIMPSGTLPIFVGDDATDEHVFRALGNHGITVRIGRKRGSGATYFLRNQREINPFLERIVALAIEQSKSHV